VFQFILPMLNEMSTSNSFDFPDTERERVKKKSIIRWEDEKESNINGKWGLWIQWITRRGKSQEIEMGHDKTHQMLQTNRKGAEEKNF